MNDRELAEIGIHLRAAVARRRRRVRRLRVAAACAAVLPSAAAVFAGGLSGGGDDAQAARIVKGARAATTRIPSGRTMLHVVTRLEDSEGAGTMETWRAGDRYRRVGFHTDGSVHAEETLQPLSGGVYEYRAFHVERDGPVIRVARTSDPHAFDTDLIDPAEDLRAAVKRGALTFVGEAVFEGTPTYELLLRLDRRCGIILPDARVFVRRDTYRPVAVRLGPAVLRFVRIEELPFDRARLAMRDHGRTPVLQVPADSRTSSAPCK
jgi:hypothetical protein